MPYLRPVEVLQNNAGTAEFVADAAVTSVVCTLERLSGDIVATLSTDNDIYSGIIASVVDDVSIVSSTSSTRAVGDPMLHTPTNGVPSRLWVSSYTAPNALSFESPPVSPLSGGDDLRDCKWTATIPASATADLGVNYRIRWVVTYMFTGAVKSYDQKCYVVRSGFPATPSITDTARFISANYPSEYELQGGERLRRVAFSAQDKLRNELLGRGRYAHLTGADSSTFAEAGLLALQSVLLMEGFFHADTDRVTYSDSLNKRFFGAVMSGLRSLTHYDADGDGVLSSSEKNRWGGIPARRY